MGQYRNPIQRKMGGIFQLPYIYGFFQGGNFSQCIAELGRTRSVRRLFAYSVRNTNELFFSYATLFENHQNKSHSQ